MPRPHPLAEQCTATAKGSGERCQLRVIGGGVCRVHGGAAPQVQTAREARIVAAEAAREAPRTAAEAADVLTGAMNDAHSLLQRLKQNIAAGRVTGADLDALGAWVDRSARIAKLVVDANIEERRTKITEAQGLVIAGVIKQVLADLMLSDEQQARVPIVVPRALLAVTAEVVES